MTDTMGFAWLIKAINKLERAGRVPTCKSLACQTVQSSYQVRRQLDLMVTLGLAGRYSRVHRPNSIAHCYTATRKGQHYAQILLPESEAEIEQEHQTQTTAPF